MKAAQWGCYLVFAGLLYLAVGLATADGLRPTKVDAAPVRVPASEGISEDDNVPRMAQRFRLFNPTPQSEDGKKSEEWSTALSPGQPRPPLGAVPSKKATIAEDAAVNKSNRKAAIKQDPAKDSLPSEKKTVTTRSEAERDKVSKSNSAESNAVSAAPPKQDFSAENPPEDSKETPKPTQNNTEPAATPVDDEASTPAKPSPPDETSEHSVLRRGDAAHSADDDLAEIFDAAEPEEMKTTDSVPAETPTPAVPAETPKNAENEKAKARKFDLAREPQHVAELPDRIPPKAEPKVSPPDRETAPTPPAPLTRDLIRLRNFVRRAVAIYSQKPLNARDHSPWEVFHAILGGGTDAQLLRYPGGPAVNAVGYMCYNYPCRGERLFYLDEHQQIVVRKGPGLQGHYGQFLAVLAQSHVREDYPLLIGDKHFTVKDLIEHEQKDCMVGEELTFKLIALSHYLPLNETWTSQDGQEWSIERLLTEEIKQPINGAACGGTHRLMGLGYALHMREELGGSVDGEFERARNYLNEYHRYTFSLQNPDGSFSTEWFRRKGSNPDVERRVKTTGHVVEWLAFTLPDSEVAKPAVQRAVEYLARVLIDNQNHVWENGPRGHALRALRLYDERVFQPAEEQAVARAPQRVARRLDPPMILPESDTESAAPAPRPARSAKQWDHEPDEGSAN